MKISLSLFFAMRFIFKSSYKKIFSCISYFTIIPSIIVLIVSLSTINGFEYEIKNRILNVIPHAEIEFKDNTNNWEKILNKIKKVEEVSLAVPYIKIISVLDNDKNLKGVQIQGIDLQSKEKVNLLNKFIKKISWEKFFYDKNQVIIGKNIASKFDFKIGDWIKFIILNKKNNIFLYLRLQVCGIFEINEILDSNLALIPMNNAQNYLNMQNKITGIAINFFNPFQANENLLKIISKLNIQKTNNYTWINMYNYMYDDIQMIRIILYLSMFLIFLISYFNTISIIIMIVKNKNKDIAILTTLGLSKKIIKKIFIWYGIINGLLSSIIGTIIGIFTSVHINSLINTIESFFRIKIFIKNIYFIDFIPSKLDWISIFLIFSTSFLLNILASKYPAKIAMKINPVNILNKN